MKLAVLIKWLDSEARPVARLNERAALVVQWEELRAQFDDGQLRAMAAKAAQDAGALPVQPQRRRRGADDSSDSDSDADGGGAGGAAAAAATAAGTPGHVASADQVALVGRRFEDTADGTSWIVFAVGYDDSGVQGVCGVSVQCEQAARNLSRWLRVYGCR